MDDNMLNTQWDSYSACACVEGFDREDHTEEEMVSAWQFLIDKGICWQLQGWYCRTAAELIDQGICKKAGAK